MADAKTMRRTRKIIRYLLRDEYVGGIVSHDLYSALCDTDPSIYQIGDDDPDIKWFVFLNKYVYPVCEDPTDKDIDEITLNAVLELIEHCLDDEWDDGRSMGLDLRFLIYDLRFLPPLCYSVRRVAHDRRCIEAKGHKLSEEGARSMLGREHRNYIKAFGSSDWQPDTMEELLDRLSEAYCGRLPNVRDDDGRSSRSHDDTL